MIGIIKQFQEINYKKSVNVYRNLKYRDKVVYSVKQGNKVVAHMSSLKLEGKIRFSVSTKGVERIRLKKQKEVVAYIQGLLSNDHIAHPTDFKVSFNPYHHMDFMVEQVSVNTMAQASFVIFNENGVFVSF